MPPLKLTILGGLGEIGKNMMALEYAGDIIIIDAGLKFPSDLEPGIDMIIPDPAFLKRNQDHILAYVITHGHEDHIGALPFFLNTVLRPVYGSKLTLAFIRHKLEQAGMENVPLNTIVPGTRQTMGPFDIEFVHVTHSIPGGVGLIIRTPAGTVIHTGDFKVDHTPMDETVIDLYRFARAGDEGVLLLLSDSTNIEREGHSRSEKDLAGPLEKIWNEAPGRILTASFASNIHRLQHILRVSRLTNRVVAVSGYSIQRNMEMARRLGFLNIPPDCVFPLEEVLKLPPQRVVIITTGSQGEPMSALSRIAAGDHPRIEITPTDTVVLSASVIPGNEKTVSRIINAFFKKKVRVYYQGLADTHASGHGAREELKLMLNLTKPRFFVPIHGEHRHLALHGALAESMGIPPDNIFIIENGDTLTCENQSMRKQREDAGELYIDGKGHVSNTVFQERQILSDDGIIFISIVYNEKSGLLDKPAVLIRGVLGPAAAEPFVETLQNKISELTENGPDADILEADIYDHVRQSVRLRLNRQPMIIVNVHRL